MNLFIGVIMNSMQESQEEMKKVILKTDQREPATQQLLADLEQKIDSLKLDIQQLSEKLKQ
jgi:hypothetical protein